MSQFDNLADEVYLSSVSLFHFDLSFLFLQFLVFDSYIAILDFPMAIGLGFLRFVGRRWLGFSFCPGAVIEYNFQYFEHFHFDFLRTIDHAVISSCLREPDLVDFGRNSPIYSPHRAKTTAALACAPAIYFSWICSFFWFWLDSSFSNWEHSNSRSFGPRENVHGEFGAFWLSSLPLFDLLDWRMFPL